MPGSLANTAAAAQIMYVHIQIVNRVVSFDDSQGYQIVVGKPTLVHAVFV